MNVTVGTEDSQTSEVIRLVFMTNKRLFGISKSKEPVISVTFHDYRGKVAQRTDVKLYVDPQKVTTHRLIN